MWLEITIAITAGIFIELFFRVIKYHSQNESQKPTLKYQPYNNYITVAEFVANGDKRWIRYFLFRTLPPFVILVFTMSLYQKYLNISNPLILFLITTIISLLPRDISSLLMRRKMLSEKIFHFINCVTLVSAALFLSIIYKYINLSVFAPSLNGVVDNLWSSLFVALLVILYLDATNQNSVPDKDTDDIRKYNYIVSSFSDIERAYGKVIEECANNNNVSIPLLYAILIYENMNRPEWVRKIENQIVSLFKLQLTVGIAQVKSNKPLSNDESITKAGEYLRNTKDLFLNNSIDKQIQQKEVIGAYNGGKLYTDSIIYILGVMRQYTPKAFII